MQAGKRVGHSSGKLAHLVDEGLSIASHTHRLPCCLEVTPAEPYHGFSNVRIRVAYKKVCRQYPYVIGLFKIWIITSRMQYHAFSLILLLEGLGTRLV